MRSFNTICVILKIKFKEEIMSLFIKNIAALIKVKTVVTLAVLAVFTVLSLRGDITPDNVMVIVSSVVAFYFGTQHERMNGVGDGKDV